jgi:hypothetical protein
MPLTPNIGLTQPQINSSGWGAPTNTDWSIIDSIFGGTFPIPALTITNDLSVGGTVTAGAFSGLDGAFFLQSSLFNQPNGVPQLNGSGKIPTALIAGSALITVAYSAVPSFNGANANGFNITLTGNVTGSTFINGTSGGTLVVFRIIQDATGGRTFVWPTNIHNGQAPSPAPNAKSTQAFALNTDGSLDAISGMFFS